MEREVPVEEREIFKGAVLHRPTAALTFGSSSLSFFNAFRLKAVLFLSTSLVSSENSCEAC